MVIHFRVAPNPEALRTNRYAFTDIIIHDDLLRAAQEATPPIDRLDFILGECKVHLAAALQRMDYEIAQTR